MKNRKEISVTIGTPHNRDLTPEYVNSLLGMVMKTAFSTPVQVRLHLHEGCYVHQGRNKIADKCHTDYLLFIDSDMAFPVDGLMKLIDLDKDICGGMYFSRKAPNLPLVYHLKEGNYAAIEEIPDKPFSCDAIATGFMLIKKEVLDGFDSYVKKNKQLPFDFMKQTDGELGEDLAFCKRAKELGFEIWCDPTIEIGHVATEVVTRNNYEAYKL